MNIETTNLMDDIIQFIMNFPAVNYFVQLTRSHNMN